MLKSKKIVNKVPIFEDIADLNANISPQKFKDPGIDIFAKVKIKNKEASIGIQDISPLKNLIILE